MPVIPTYQSSQSIDTGARTMPHVVDTGAPLANALAGLGSEIEDVGLRMIKQQAQVERFNTAQEFERFNNEIGSAEVENRAKMAPGAVGYHDQFMGGVFEPKSKEFLGAVPARLRPEYEQRLATAKSAWSEKVARTEYSARQNWFKDGVERAAAAGAAEAELNPEGWQDQVGRLRATLNDSPLSPLEKETLGRNYGSMIAEGAVRGALARARETGVAEERDAHLETARRIARGDGLKPEADPLDPDVRRLLAAKTETAALKIGSDARAERAREITEVKSLMGDSVASAMETGTDLPKTVLDFKRVERALGRPAAEEWARDVETARRTHALVGDLEQLTPEQIAARVAATLPKPGDRHYVDQQKIHAYALKKADALTAWRSDDPAAAVSNLPNVRAARDALSPDVPATYEALVRERKKAQAQIGIPEGMQTPLTKTEARVLMAPFDQAGPLDQDKALAEIVAKVEGRYGAYAKEVLTFSLRQTRMSKELGESASGIMLKLLKARPNPGEAAQADRGAEIQAQDNAWRVPYPWRWQRDDSNFDPYADFRGAPGAAAPAPAKAAPGKDQDRPFQWKTPPRGEQFQRDVGDFLSQPGVPAVRAAFEDIYGKGAAALVEKKVMDGGARAFPKGVVR